MHTIARNGINSSVGSSRDGNAITGITVDNANNKISVTKATCFAVAKGNNESCIDNAGRADKADALNVSAAVGSVTRGVYINANGIPTQMTYSLGTTVPANTCMIKSISNGLQLSSNNLSLDFATCIDAGLGSAGDRPVTANMVYTYVTLAISNALSSFAP